MTRRAPLLLALLAASPASAGPEEVPVHAVRVTAAGGRLALSCDLRDLLDEATRRRLTSGFTVRFVERAYLFDSEEDEALAAAARIVEVRYDLWDEDFAVVERLAAGEAARRLASAAEVERLVSTLADLDAFDAALLQPERRYYVAVVAEVDPLSDEQLSEVRRWLARPEAGHRDLALGGRSFLGSFVSLFVNFKVGQAARVVRLRSEPLASGDLVSPQAAGG